MRALDLTGSYLASIVRLGTGMAVGHLGARPEQPLELYEFEACPFCRKVREALSILDLEAIIKPCPKGGERFRDVAYERGHKMQFPYLVDPNRGVEMYESDDILRYLFETYGDGSVPWALMPPLGTIGAAMASLARPTAGGFARASLLPAQPLELWSFEASPYCRLVRETLCSLEIPYLLHNVAKGSPRRAAFAERTGRMQVPYLVDPNTDVAMFESADIVEYLEATYAAAPVSAARRSAAQKGAA